METTCFHQPSLFCGCSEIVYSEECAPQIHKSLPFGIQSPMKEISPVSPSEAPLPKSDHQGQPRDYHMFGNSCYHFVCVSFLWTWVELGATLGPFLVVSVAKDNESMVPETVRTSPKAAPARCRQGSEFGLDP